MVEAQGPGLADPQLEWPRLTRIGIGLADPQLAPIDSDWLTRMGIPIGSALPPDGRLEPIGAWFHAAV